MPDKRRMLIMMSMNRYLVALIAMFAMNAYAQSDSDGYWWNPREFAPRDFEEQRVPSQVPENFDPNPTRVPPTSLPEATKRNGSEAIINPQLVKPSSLAGGQNYVCSVENGYVYCAGDAQIAKYANQVSDVVSIEGDDDRVCVILKDTTAKCWGQIPSGGYTFMPDVPVPLLDEYNQVINGVVQIVVAKNADCILLQNGDAMCRSVAGEYNAPFKMVNNSIKFKKVPGFKFKQMADCDFSEPNGNISALTQDGGIVTAGLSVVSKQVFYNPTTNKYELKKAPAPVVTGLYGFNHTCILKADGYCDIPHIPDNVAVEKFGEPGPFMGENLVYMDPKGTMNLSFDSGGSGVRSLLCGDDQGVQKCMSVASTSPCALVPEPMQKPVEDMHALRLGYSDFLCRKPVGGDAECAVLTGPYCGLGTKGEWVKLSQLESYAEKLKMEYVEKYYNKTSDPYGVPKDPYANP